jgi:hypothetical protein
MVERQFTPVPLALHSISPGDWFLYHIRYQYLMVLYEENKSGTMTNKNYLNKLRRNKVKRNIYLYCVCVLHMRVYPEVSRLAA